MNGIEQRLFDRPLAVKASYARTLAAYAARHAGEQRVVFTEGEAKFEIKTGPDQEAFFDFMFGGDDDFELRDGIAIIPVRGCLSQRSWWRGSYESIASTFRAALDNREVDAILFDIDSPGGDVSGLFDLVDEIHAARGTKPIWAMASELAASAAYAIGSAAEKLYLPRTGEVGSIGVVMLHYDETGAMEKYGITITPIYSGAHKIDGAWFQKLSEPARTRFQSEVSDTYELFVSTVARNRGLTVEAVRGTEALTYRGQHAIAAGLADGVMARRAVLSALLAEVTGTEADPAATPTTRNETMKKPAKPGVARRAAAAKKPKAEDQRPADDMPAADPENPEDAEDPVDPENPDPAEDPVDPENPADAEDPAKDDKAAAAERKRISAILGCEEARGKNSLANHLALGTSVSLAEAKATLKAASAEGSSTSLSSRMPGRDPSIGQAAPAAADPRVAATRARYAVRHGLNN